MGRLRMAGGWVLLATLLIGIAGCVPAPTLSIGAPSVADTAHGPVTFVVTYVGAQEISLASGQVSLQTTGTATGDISISGAGATSRTVTLSNLTGDGTLAVRLDEGTATSASKLPAPAAGPSAAVRVDNTPPTASLGAPSASVTNAGPVTYTVTYGGASAINLAQASVQLIATGTATATIDEVTGEGLETRTITLSGIAGEGTLGVAIPAGTATDAAGNLAPEIAPSATVTVDNTPPSLSISGPSTAATATGPVDYKVNYDGADTIALSKTNVLVNGSGTTGANLEEVSATGDTERTVTLSNIIGNGTLGISIAAGTASDAAGNPAPEAGPSATFEVNNVAPTLNISEPSAPETFDGPINFVITYADAETITLSPDDIILNSDGGVTAMVAVSGAGNTERTVTLSDINGQGPASISVAGRTAVNSAAVQAGTAGPSATFKVNPLLTPGTGFTGPTPQPDPIGTPGAPGIDAKAIARWDVVPYQTFDGYFNVGVVAFHINDIDRVEFSVQGGPWTAVKEMTLNPQTNVVEYWAGIDARDFPDGPIEVRAVAYPKVGVPRVLGGAMDQSEADERGEHSILVNTNASHTIPSIVRYVAMTGDDVANDGSVESPFATIWAASRAIEQEAGSPNFAGNGTVLLSAGQYDFGGRPGYGTFVPNTPNSFLTIQGVPGSTRNQISLVSSSDPSALGASKVCIRGITVTSGLVAPSSIGAVVWFDDCILMGTSRVDNITFSGPTVWTGGTYVTRTLVRDVANGVQYSRLQRNVDVENIASDAFSDTGLTVNCSVNGIDPSLTMFHPDVYQFQSRLESVIIYGLTANSVFSQGVFGGNPVNDVAIINCQIDNRANPPAPPNPQAVWQFLFETSNLFVRDSVFLGPSYWVLDRGFVAHNVVVENSVFGELPPFHPTPEIVDGVVYRVSTK